MSEMINNQMLVCWRRRLRASLFYAGGGPDSTRAEINLATSTNLDTWRRLPSGPLFRDGYDARDPMVTRIDGQWVMFYCATSNNTGGNYVVAYRTSSDLIHWSARSIAFTDPTSGTFGGNTESPCVVQRNGSWYLFLGPRGDYVGTDVFRSSSPFAFDPSHQVGHVHAHAAEVVRDGTNWWISSAGWGRGGLDIAPLTWHDHAISGDNP